MRRRLRVSVVELLNDATDALFANIGDGRVVLAAGGFRKLDENKVAVAAVLFVDFQHCVGGSARPSEEIKNDILILGL